MWTAKSTIKRVLIDCFSCPISLHRPLYCPVLLSSTISFCLSYSDSPALYKLLLFSPFFYASQCLGSVSSYTFLAFLLRSTFLPLSYQHSLTVRTAPRKMWTFFFERLFEILAGKSKGHHRELLAFTTFLDWANCRAQTLGTSATSSIRHVVQLVMACSDLGLYQASDVRWKLNTISKSKIFAGCRRRRGEQRQCSVYEDHCGERLRLWSKFRMCSD